MVCLRHIRYHGVLLWNKVTVYWLSVGTWFGTTSALGDRRQARGLRHPLFVAQTMWFQIPNVCNARGKWVEHGNEDHEKRDSNSIYLGFRLREAPV